ncbi:MAG: MBL fold metallo-hydrolase [Candidatus Aenigmarchaeota archaeon]|nr:MBL fold metallo-hydrolase [Candidatus Aenigmarchaeota archaeon]
MIFEKYEGGPLLAISYLVADEKPREGIIIDAAQGAAEALSEFVNKNKLEILYLINTHGHWDHIQDNNEIKKAFGCRIACHRLDAEWLEKPNAYFALPMKIEPSKPDKHLEDNGILKIGNLEFRILHTPGHTQGSICLYLERQKMLFTGDVLFAGTYGRVDFPKSDPKKMRETLKRLSMLPPETKVYPGHGGSTTIGDEKWLMRL